MWFICQIKVYVIFFIYIDIYNLCIVELINDFMIFVKQIINLMNIMYIILGEVGMFENIEVLERVLLQWFRAVFQGSIVVRVKMGDYYYYGYGIKIDYEIAVSYYRLVSE